MRTIVTLPGIDEAIKNLGYTNEKHIKARFIKILRQYYSDENSVRDVTEISSDELIRLIWDTDGSGEATRHKRKNFSSIKSSINSDLSRLHDEGKNPDGVVVGRNNTFDMSDKAKNELLENFTNTAAGDGVIPLGKINDVLEIVNDILKKNNSGDGADSQNNDNGFNQLKELIQSISKNIGMSGSQNQIFDSGHQLSGADGPQRDLKTDSGTETGSGGNLEKEITDKLFQKSGDQREAAGGSLKNTGTATSGENFQEVETSIVTSDDINEVKKLDDIQELDEIEDEVEEVDELPLEEVEGEAEIVEADEDLEEAEDEEVPDDELEEVEELDDIQELDEVEDEVEEVDELPLEEVEDEAEIVEADEDLEEVEYDKVPEDEFEEVEELDDAQELDEVEDEVEDETEIVEAGEDLEEVEDDEVPEDEFEEVEELDDAQELDEVEDEVEEIDALPSEEIEDENEIIEVDEDLEEVEDDEVPEDEFEEVEEFNDAQELDEIEVEVKDETEIVEADEDLEEVEDDEVPEDEFEEVEELDDAQELDEAEDEVEEIDALPSEEIEDENEIIEADEDLEEVGDDKVPEDEFEEVEELDDAQELDESEVEVKDETEIVEAGEDFEELEQGEVPDDDFEEVDELPLEEVEDETEAVDADEDIEEIEEEEVPDDEFEEVEELDDAQELDEVEDEVEEIDALPSEEIEDETEIVEADEDLEKVEDDEVPEDELEEVEIEEIPDDEFEEVIEPDPEFEGPGKAENGISQARVLAEEFNNMLSAMDRFYNQYILVPKGRYLTGSSNGKREDNPSMKINVSAFYFGKFPVTNALFEIFVEKTGYVTTAEKMGRGTVYYGRYQNVVDNNTGMRSLNWSSTLETRVIEGACWYLPAGPGSTLYNKRNHPVVQVSLEDALAFAAWTGKKLPTEAQWEAASRTSGGYKFPWGKEFKKGFCNFEDSCIGDTTPVDKYLESENSLGIVDTLGNVMEWTIDKYEPFTAEKHAAAYVIKGGSWISGNDLCLDDRSFAEASTASNILGFRCVAH